MKNNYHLLLLLLPLVSIYCFFTTPQFLLRYNSVGVGIALYLLFFLPILYIVGDPKSQSKSRKYFTHFITFLTAICIIIGPYLGWITFEKSKNTYFKNSIIVQAVVVDNSILEGKRRGKSYQLICEYLSLDSTKHRKLFLLSEEEYHNAPVGSLIKIEYSAEDSNIARPLFD